ncbi:unnamed protein product [Larinioides sclopetarius]|uniref:Uncharacterized protein n=1 Tax=Larinioides sclopetarius TaxID=280406 RepID=A0AAV1ZPZ0_9ARAC
MSANFIGKRKIKFMSPKGTLVEKRQNCNYAISFSVCFPSFPDFSSSAEKYSSISTNQAIPTLSKQPGSIEEW